MEEFGLSFLGRSRRGTDMRHLLVDFGCSSEVLANNIELVSIDPASIDAALLSHGHLDHYGGFAGVFGAKVGEVECCHSSLAERRRSASAWR